MKSDPQKKDPVFKAHQKSFERQSKNTKELELLSEKVEKTTGPEVNVLQELILVKSEEEISLAVASKSRAVSPGKS